MLLLTLLCLLSCECVVVHGEGDSWNQQPTTNNQQIDTIASLHPVVLDIGMGNVYIDTLQMVHKTIVKYFTLLRVVAAHIWRIDMKTPDFYKPERERLSLLDTRVDERDLAFMQRFLEAQFSVFVQSRSELGRAIVEFASSVARMKRPDIPTHDTSTEAGEFLRSRGLGHRKGTRRREHFDRLITGSDSFDATHGMKQRSNIDMVVEALSILKEQGESSDTIKRRAKKACEEGGYDYDTIIRRVFGSKNWMDDTDAAPSGSATDVELTERRKRIDKEQLERMKRSLGAVPPNVVRGE